MAEEEAAFWEGMTNVNHDPEKGTWWSLREWI